MHGRHRVARIAVCADRICILLRQNCAANHHLGVRLFLTQQPDGLLHADDRSGHERAQADKRNLFLDRGIYDYFGRNVLAQVEHLIAVVLKQNLDDVLANIVDIALDSRQDDLEMPPLPPPHSSAAAAGTRFLLQSPCPHGQVPGSARC